MRLPRKTKKALKKFLSNILLSSNEIKRVKSIFQYDDWKNCVYNRTGPWTLSVCGIRYAHYLSMLRRPHSIMLVENVYDNFLSEVAKCQKQH